MIEDREIVESIRGLVPIPIQVKPGEVLSVDRVARTADVMLAGDEVPLSASLQSILGKDQGLVTFPKVGSQVLVSMIGNEEAEGFVVSCAELDSFELVIGGLKLTMDATGLRLGDDAAGGLVLVEPLVRQINELRQLVFSHQHTVVVPAVPATVITIPDLISNPVPQPVTVAELASKTVFQ